MTYEQDDYLLIRNDEVIAVSGNADFVDGEHPITGRKTDTVARVVSNGDEIAYINVDFKSKGGCNDQTV